MKGTITHKILSSHLTKGSLDQDGEIEFSVDSALIQDATGTMVCQQFEMLNLPRIKVDFAIIYVDHNMIQLDYRNPEDHMYLMSFASKYGIHYSKPGNGICHQVNTERFAQPGKILVGADSHTPTAGSVGAFAIGAGGIDVALTLAGKPFELRKPIVTGVLLTGSLKPWVSGKDVILEMLRRYTVKGGLDRVYEFKGPGVKTLSVFARATICNMIAELGATTGIFPSDENTLEFFRLQDRENHWIELKADQNAEYDDEIEINLSDIEPLIACPSNPDNVVPVREVEGTKVHQVCIGSSVNSWYPDLAIPAAILKGKRIAQHTVMTVSPGSRQILDTISKSGVLTDLIQAGARILEPACGPCVGMGQAPAENLPSVRTFNRNFRGRSGTKNDKVYLASPETAGASALYGEITDPRRCGDYPTIKIVKPVINDEHILKPLDSENAKNIKVTKGKNIVMPPIQEPNPEPLIGRVAIKLENNISTGSISPDGVIIMADRSNIPAISRYTFMKEDENFIERAKEYKTCFIVAGENYGQGSSREHAVLAPKYLGVRGVFAKSIHRIHKKNLIQHGLIPMVIGQEFYGSVAVGATINLPNWRNEFKLGNKLTIFLNDKQFNLDINLNEREKEIILAGGVLSYYRP